jgi:hypothetical protein
VEWRGGGTSGLGACFGGVRLGICLGKRRARTDCVRERTKTALRHDNLLLQRSTSRLLVVVVVHDLEGVTTGINAFDTNLVRVCALPARTIRTLIRRRDGKRERASALVEGCDELLTRVRRYDDARAIHCIIAWQNGRALGRRFCGWQERVRELDVGLARAQVATGGGTNQQ